MKSKYQIVKSETHAVLSYNAFYMICYLTEISLLLIPFFYIFKYRLGIMMKNSQLLYMIMLVMLILQLTCVSYAIKFSLRQTEETCLEYVLL